MATKNCPYCAEEIQESAVKCKHCGTWLPAAGAAEVPLPAEPPGSPPAASRWLMRTSQNTVIAGVCGGLAVSLGMDPTIIRIIYAVATVFTAFMPGIIVYIILALVMPSDAQ